MTATGALQPRRDDLRRDTLVLSALNLTSRLSGFARVLAVGAALGATSLGDAYQAANLVSNILFELLAGGILAAVLVPTFVGLIEGGRTAEAARLARDLMVRVVGALAVVVVLGVALAPRIMDLLTITVADAEQRRLQAELGTFLLWFFLPQVLLYALGAITTALLQADRRFVAAAIAPICNNLVVIATMVAFGWAADGDASLPLSTSQQLVLAVGTTLGVVVMTAAPWVAARRAGLLAAGPGSGPSALGPLARKGAWAAGHLGAQQVLIAVTVVVAAATQGGVIAYQIAFTFFLLPHAVLAHPVATALYPRLAADAAAGRIEHLASELARGLRLCALLVVPAAVGLAVLASPGLHLARLGNLDAAGADLVAAALAAYSVGLLGYSSVLLLTRAAYALDDTRTPTLVLGVATVAGVAAMLIVAGRIDGTGRLVALGIIHGVAQSAAAIALWAAVRQRLGSPVPVAGALARAAAGAAVAGPLAWWAASSVGTASRLDAAVAVGVGAAVMSAVYLAVLKATRAPELARLGGARP